MLLAHLVEAPVELGARALGLVGEGRPVEALRKEPGDLVFALEPHLWESHFDIPCRLRARSLGPQD